MLITVVLHLKHVLRLLALCALLALADSEIRDGEYDNGERFTADFDALWASLSQVGYDNRIRPNLKGKPVNVQCAVYINSVNSLSEISMEFTVDFYLLQSWNDYRVRWYSPNEETVNVADDHVHVVWQPDTFITNAKTGSFHEVTKANTYFEINSQGKVQESSRMTVTASCIMDFHQFPFDFQRCFLRFESFSQPVTDVTYSWFKPATAETISNLSVEDYKMAATFAEPGSSLSHYAVTGFRLTESVETRHDGFNHSYLGIDFYFSRKLGCYLIQFYVPSSILVVCSCISFWLPRDSSPARVTLSVTINLAMVTLNCQETHAPKVPYLKALDVYISFCFIMVFLSLIEFAVVSYTADALRKQQKRLLAYLKHSNRVRSYNKLLIFTRNVTRRKSCGDDKDIDTPPLSEDDLASQQHMSPVSLPSPSAISLASLSNSISTSFYRRHKIPGGIECAARVLFPVIFSIFNFVYWTYYYYLSSDDHSDDPGVLHFSS